MTTININLKPVTDPTANAIRDALTLAGAGGKAVDARLEPEMRALLKEWPKLASHPGKLLAGAEVRTGVRDKASWSKVIASLGQ